LKYIDLNKQCDIGGLIFEDCQSYATRSAAEIADLTKQNYCLLLRELFNMRKA
jgi:regulator of ribosome biosynthesis